ncbi:MAG: DUF1330 domain-containing protein [Candidatus Heimdallarchaeota archaeon]
MVAYLIADVNITDPEGYQKYLALVGASLEQFGATPVVVVGAHAGGKCETLEGDWHPNHLVVLKFDSLDQLKKWYASPEYTKANEIRQRVAKANFIALEPAESLSDD